MRVAIIANVARSDVAQLNIEQINTLAAKYGLVSTLHVVNPEEIATLMQELLEASYNGFIVAGGDGTVRSVAEELVNQETPLAILPLGTFNYFAKELGFPNDLEVLFQIIKNNKTKLVDVSEVNNLVFINHSSIGFYSHILKLREKHKHLLGKSRLLKILFSLFNFFDAVPLYSLKLTIDNQIKIIETCFIFIGNNYHLTNLLEFGERDVLTGGVLSIYILKCKTRWEIMKCIFSVLFNTFDKQKYLTEFSVDNLIIEAKSKTINVVLDGELIRLDSPLTYSIHHKKLMVYAV